MTKDKTSQPMGALEPLHCHRCGYDWYPKNPNAPKPVVCARCKNPRWDVPRAEGGENSPDASIREQTALQDYLHFIRHAPPAVVRGIKSVVAFHSDNISRRD